MRNKSSTSTSRTYFSVPMNLCDNIVLDVMPINMMIVEAETLSIPDCILDDIYSEDRCRGLCWYAT